MFCNLNIVFIACFVLDEQVCCLLE